MPDSTHTPDPRPASPARDAYSAASDRDDAPANGLWARFSRRALELADPRDGASVLDVCCGSGELALAAAERVGPTGRVLGIDAAERLLALAEAQAAARGLPLVTWAPGRLEDVDRRDQRFDVVACVFFASDMPGAVAALRRRVRSASLDVRRLR